MFRVHISILFEGVTLGLFRRSAGERDQCSIIASVLIEGRKVACKIVNLSEEGAGLLFDRDVEDLPDRFVLSLPVVDGCTQERKVELRWLMDRRAGVLFSQPIAQATAA